MILPSGGSGPGEPNAPSDDGAPAGHSGRADALDRIRSYFTERLGIAAPPPEVDLIEEGLLDSLAFVNLILHLEEEFGIEIPLADVDFEQFRSLQRIVSFLDGPSGEAAAASTGPTDRIAESPSARVSHDPFEAP